MGESPALSRRDFLRTGAAAVAVAAASSAVASKAVQPADAEQPQKEPGAIVLPGRRLGRTGVEITILAQGAAFDISERHLNIMHELGVRVIDTAAHYLAGNAERTIGQWFNRTGRRREYFLVDKDIPLTPKEMARMIDERLATLQTDYLDLFLLGAMGDSDRYHGLDDTKWFTDRDWTRAVERIRASGKCRFFGFSTHTEPIDIRSGMLEAAAKGGWVDAILVSADPTVLRDDLAFAKAVDACYKAGVGLISMKQNRGVPHSTAGNGPNLDTTGLNPHTVVLRAMWSDERISSVCSHMNTIRKLHENATACKGFRPLTDKEIGAVDSMLRGGERSYCVACDGSCRRAAGTRAHLNTIARYVSYADQDGQAGQAREMLLKMPPETRDWSDADLLAARRGCKRHLDFAGIVKRAEELMA